jgi:hypothetical protein
MTFMAKPPHQSRVLGHITGNGYNAAATKCFHSALNFFHEDEGSRVHAAPGSLRQQAHFCQVY